jgi:hypothetical protein
VIPNVLSFNILESQCDQTSVLEMARQDVECSSKIAKIPLTLHIITGLFQFGPHGLQKFRYSFLSTGEKC